MDWWCNNSLTPFKVNSSLIIAGATGSGKTCFAHKILDNNYVTWYGGVPPIEIIYCYGQWQSYFNQIEKDVTDIIFHNGLPNTEDIDTWKSEHTLIILDDLMNEVLKNAITQKRFTIGCHHMNINCIFMTQDLYNQGKFTRTITLNVTYLILFENIRNSSQVMRSGSQIYPGNQHVFIHAYKSIFKTSYGYMVIDINPQSNLKHRIPRRISIYLFTIFLLLTIGESRLLICLQCRLSL